jgi:hypothetical protein
VLVPVGAIVALSLHAMESAGDAALASLQHILPTSLSLDGGDMAAAVSSSSSGAVGDAGGLLGGVDASLLTDLGWAAINVLMIGWFLALNQVRMWFVQMILNAHAMRVCGAREAGTHNPSIVDLTYTSNPPPHQPPNLNPFFASASLSLSLSLTHTHTQVILVQRDAFLANSIVQTCREHPGQRVAAVLGLLHSNGVARHLRAKGFRLVDRE